MKISGMNTELLKSYIEAEKRLQTPEKKAAGCRTTTESLSYQREEYHLDLEFVNGTNMSLDFVYEAMQRKTSNELKAYSDYSYKNDYYSPENTAGRILDFARGLWDGSSDRLELLTKSINEGIAQARDELGPLPEWLDNLIGGTEKLVRQGLEEMQQEAAANEPE